MAATEADCWTASAHALTAMAQAHGATAADIKGICDQAAAHAGADARTAQQARELTMRRICAGMTSYLLDAGADRETVLAAGGDAFIAHWALSATDRPLALIDQG